MSPEVPEARTPAPATLVGFVAFGVALGTALPGDGALATRVASWAPLDAEVVGTVAALVLEAVLGLFAGAAAWSRVQGTGSAPTLGSLLGLGVTVAVLGVGAAFSGPPGVGSGFFVVEVLAVTVAVVLGSVGLGAVLLRILDGAAAEVLAAPAPTLAAARLAVGAAALSVLVKSVLGGPLLWALLASAVAGGVALVASTGPARGWAGLAAAALAVGGAREATWRRAASDLDELKAVATCFDLRSGSGALTQAALEVPGVAFAMSEDAGALVGGRRAADVTVAPRVGVSDTELQPALEAALAATRCVDLGRVPQPMTPRWRAAVPRPTRVSVRLVPAPGTEPEVAEAAVRAALEVAFEAEHLDRHPDGGAIAWLPTVVEGVERLTWPPSADRKELAGRFYVGPFPPPEIPALAEVEVVP